MIRHFSEALFDDLNCGIVYESYEKNLEEVEDLILASFGADHPGKGCSFITPNGKFVNLFPFIIDHNRLCDFVNNRYPGTVTGDATWFTDNLGYVRCRNDTTMCYVTLPNKITTKQSYAIQDWLCQHMYLKNIEINAPGDIYETYNLSEYFPEDLIKIIKRFYSSCMLVR